VRAPAPPASPWWRPAPTGRPAQLHRVPRAGGDFGARPGALRSQHSASRPRACRCSATRWSGARREVPGSSPEKAARGRRSAGGGE
jgi:hypothetical protein